MPSAPSPNGLLTLLIPHCLLLVKVMTVEKCRVSRAVQFYAYLASALCAVYSSIPWKPWKGEEMFDVLLQDDLDNFPLHDISNSNVYKMYIIL